MRGRIVRVAGYEVEVIPHRWQGALVWDAYLVDDASGGCLNVGLGFTTRRDLVAWLRGQAGQQAVRDAASDA